VSPAPCVSASATGLGSGQLGVDGADFGALRRAAVDVATTAVYNLLGAQANPQNLAILSGAIAGLWPALRAARMSPTQALWSM
jgi:hypothetical protein